MVIWFSAGRGLSSLLRPLIGFAWPILLASRCWRW
jgi:lipopolysaccharide export system permease protein